MNPITMALLATALLVSAAAQAASESRNLTGFTSVSIADGIDVQVTIGDKYNVVVSTQRNNPGDVLTTLRGNELRIERRSWRWWSWGRSDYRVQVTLPVLEAISASGGSDVRGAAVMDGKDLRLSASGGSDVRFELKARELHLSASGGAEIEVSGQAERAHVRASGGADIDSSRLVAGEVAVSASGGADVQVNATRTLSAVASGGSDIRCRGDPVVKESKSSGGSDIARR
jgi:hypothetical protein